VTREGGTVAATVWDFAGGTAPVSMLWRAAREVDPAAPGKDDQPGGRDGQLADILCQTRLTEIESTALTVSFRFESFGQWWAPFTLGAARREPTWPASVTSTAPRFAKPAPACSQKRPSR
jgi:hypothetical protein